MSIKPPGAIELLGVNIRFGEGATGVEAIRHLDLSIAPGEFVSVLGPSGCGKSTLVGAIAGLQRVTSGTVLVDGAAVRGPGPERGVVFQSHTLFPWKTAAANVEFGLKMRGVDRAERSGAARGILRYVGLEEFADRLPGELSGGMQQRVNLARVLVNKPRVLLMDEPFAALDAQTRLLMQELLLQLWSEFRMTVVFVTHDIDEAIFLSDRIVVLSQRPAEIREEITVALPRPRSELDLTSQTFMQAKRRCLELLRNPKQETGSVFWKTNFPEETLTSVVPASIR
ncbi:MAG: ABC transporter ATP-binding protein [Nibricoccus sp.]